jgi:cysteine desulfurase
VLSLDSLDSSGIRNISFVGRVGTDILARMLDVAASAGSACHAGEITLSPVLKAMGVVPGVGLGAIRFSLGRGRTQEEIEEVVSRLTRALV